MEEQINYINRMVALTQHCKVNSEEVLHTSLYNDMEEFLVIAAKRKEEAAATACKENTGNEVPEANTARFDIQFVYRVIRGNLFIFADCASSF